MEQVTTNQVKEMIDQLAAMTAAASITPGIVAAIFEKMRNLNDHEREKVIKVATEYIEEIRTTGIDAEKCRTRNGSNVQADLDAFSEKVIEINEQNHTLTYRGVKYLIIGIDDGSTPSNMVATMGEALMGTSTTMGAK